MYQHLRLLSRLSVCAVILAGSVRAQSPRSPREIGQIIDVAVQAVIPFWERHANATVAERGIRFDYVRTTTAFGSTGDPTVRANLGLTHAFTPGSDSLLVDCDQMGSKTCARLGRSIYVYLESISISTSEAVAWVHMVWATTAASKRTFQASSSTEVFLARSGSGPWTFVKLGRGVIS